MSSARTIYRCTLCCSEQKRRLKAQKKAEEKASKLEGAKEQAKSAPAGSAAATDGAAKINDEELDPTVTGADSITAVAHGTTPYSVLVSAYPPSSPPPSPI